MVYAEIKVRILVNENKLTEEQQKQAAKADINIRQDHPLDDGVASMKITIAELGTTYFQYLGVGSKAIQIEIE